MAFPFIIASYDIHQRGPMTPRGLEFLRARVGETRARLVPRRQQNG